MTGSRALWITTAVIITVLLIIVFSIKSNNYINSNIQKNNNCINEYPNNIHSCCEHWADVNDIVKPSCIGEWEIKYDKCSWICSPSGTVENGTSNHS